MVPYRRINWSLLNLLIGIYIIPTWLEDWKKLECIVNPVPINCKFVFFYFLLFFLAMHTTSASIQKNATQFWNVQTVNYIISVMPFIYTYLEIKYFHIFYSICIFSFRCTFSLHYLLEINCQLVLDIPNSTLHTSRTDMVHYLLQNEF